MTRTYSQHSVPTPALGSAPHIGTAAPGTPDFTKVPAVALRRAVLAGGAALALVASSAAANSIPATEPEASLIALCADLDALQRRINDLFPADWTGMTDAELDAADTAACCIEAAQRHLLDRICTLLPATPAGCAAVARSLAVLRPDLARTALGADMDVRLTALLVRAVTGEGA